MRRWPTYLLALACGLVGCTHALPAQNKGPLKKANELYASFAYTDAIQYYERALKKGFDKTGLIRLADCYRLTHNARKAAETYSKVVNLNQVQPINYFYFAQSLMNLGMHQEAAKWFDRYAREVPSDPRGAKFAASCRTIHRYYADTAEVAVRPFPHNTRVDEFSPVWYKEGILFSSSRAEGSMVESRYDWNGQPFLDLYYAKVTGPGEKFSRPLPVKGKLNTRFHEATCAWDSLNQIAYFTRNNYFEGKKVTDEAGVVNLKLFYADVPKSGPWTNVRSLPFNSDAYSVGHPAVLHGGETLFFISDQPGGFGGTDLYRSDFKEDGWTDPMNLGPTVNSPGNEMFPYLSAEGVLYFSSDGLGGLGGLDVFMCDLNAADGKPQNVGAPINSNADDFGFLISADHSWGMFSSNRAGGMGADDLYLFTYLKPVWNGVVVDAVTRTPIPGAHVTLHLPTVSRRLSGNADPEGRLTLLLQRDATYQVVAEAEQYRPRRMEVSTYGAKSGDQLQDTILLERPPLLVITTVMDMGTGFPIRNADVRVINSSLSLKTDSTGQVSFYYDPLPDQEAPPVKCPPQASGDYCFRFQDEAALPTDTQQLTYEWSFGDGSKVREEAPRHCYAGPGTYHVELNLLDPSGKVFLNQTTYELEVRPHAGIGIEGPDTVTVGTKVPFSAALGDVEDCQPVGYEWEVNTGERLAGQDIAFAFSRPGRYQLRLSASGGTDPGCDHCVTKEVVVMDAGWRQPSRDSLAVAWSKKPTPPQANIDCVQQRPEDYCYRFTDGGGLPTDSLPFVYLWDLGDGTYMTGLTVTHCYAGPGNYPVRLEVLDPFTRRLVSVATAYDLEVKDLEQVYIASHDTVALGKEVRLDAYKSDAPGCHVQAVYWNFGDGSTGSGAEVLHTYARRGTYRVQLVLEGVDATGVPCNRCTYKEIHVLPHYRGNEVRDSLRLLATLPRVPRTMPDGTLLLEIAKAGYEKRRLNFDPGTEPGTVRDSVYLPTMTGEAQVVVEMVDKATLARLQDVTLVLRDAATGRDLGTYTVEQGSLTLPITPGRAYTLLASKQGYLTEVAELGAVEKGKKPQMMRMELRAAVVGSSWVLHNIYYDFDKHHIRHDATLELERLAGFLKANPSLTVELGSHTDVRGSDAYNVVLAQNRADAAVDYLMARGVAPNRIVARGYGEQRLFNRCANGVACSEELHQENRRTEITILGFQDPIYSQARQVEEIWGTESLSIPSSPAFSGPFTILVGTYLHQKAAGYFQGLDGRFPVRGSRVDGFWEYTTGDYPDYAAARGDLSTVAAQGFPNATVLARPRYTLGMASVEAPTQPVGQGDPASPKLSPQVDPTDAFYSIQVAVLGRTVQDYFYSSFGTYRDRLFERHIEGRRVFFVGKYASEQEAVLHLAKIRRTGHSDAFLVHFEKGKKTNLDKIGAH